MPCRVLLCKKTLCCFNTTMPSFVGVYACVVGAAPAPTVVDDREPSDALEEDRADAEEEEEEEEEEEA